MITSIEGRGFINQASGVIIVIIHLTVSVNGGP